MDSLKIGGVVRLAINDDPERVITFVPDDALFAEKFYAVYSTLKVRLDEFSARGDKLIENDAVDEFDVPEIAPEVATLRREACDSVCEEIDKLFGSGTSEKAFGEHRSLIMIEDFFDGVMPYITKVRKKKTGKYTKDVIEKRRQIEQEKAAKAAKSTS
jgi:hypothetical protein